MKNTFKLVQNLQNLNRIKRTGGNLALGLPAEWNITIAEHSYAVSYLAMMFYWALPEVTRKEVDLGKILSYCLVHDWKEIVLGDIPAPSPSFASFWEIDIKEATKKAGEKVMVKFKELIEGEMETIFLTTELNDTEKKITKAADIGAYLFELQEWKYLGYQHEGWEMIWYNVVGWFEKIELPFVPQLATEFKEAYKKGTKAASPFLAQGSKQENPERKI
jgi:5'-deoxynucleotidase YfbR-like HD superfamily hydrolase